MTRKCGDCTACCEGWLRAVIGGKEMSPGQPCQFLDKTCTIYDKRPKNPCQDYVCAWLSGELPMSLKPNFVKLIVSKKGYKNIEYYDATEAGKRITAPVLNELIQWAHKNKKNLLYRMQDQAYTIGTEEFMALQNEILKSYDKIINTKR